MRSAECRLASTLRILFAPRGDPNATRRALLRLRIVCVALCHFRRLRFRHFSHRGLLRRALRGGSALARRRSTRCGLLGSFASLRLAERRLEAVEDVPEDLDLELRVLRALRRARRLRRSLAARFAALLFRTRLVLVPILAGALDELAQPGRAVVVDMPSTARFVQPVLRPTQEFDCFGAGDPHRCFLLSFSETLVIVWKITTPLAAESTRTSQNPPRGRALK